MSLTSEIGRQKKETARSKLDTAIKSGSKGEVSVAKERLTETYERNTPAGNGKEKAQGAITDIEACSLYEALSDDLG